MPAVALLLLTISTRLALDESAETEPANSSVALDEIVATTPVPTEAAPLVG